MVRLSAGIENFGAQHAAEIPGAEVGRRDGKQACAPRAFERAFPVREEEQLVFLDRSAEVSAGGAAALVGPVGQAGKILVPGEGPHGVVREPGEHGAAKIVRPGFGYHRHRSASGHPLLGVEVVC